MPNITVVLLYPVRKVVKCAQNINNWLVAPEKVAQQAAEKFEYITKLFGATTGSVQVTKGVVDMAEAAMCLDGPCFIVSTVGTAADILQLAGTCVIGPNVTTLVTMPISLGCKTFVFCCKRSLLPWGTCHPHKLVGSSIFILKRVKDNLIC